MKHLGIDGKRVEYRDLPAAGFRNWNIDDCLPNIRCPLPAIQGEDDEYATMRQIDVIGERVPGARLLKLAD
ncbi:MAG: hypothetical protein L6Q60_14305 [Rhodocyclaceae bacterium]|nr:hypothetical protein [Rhodocyclaceae bacterium]